MIARQIPYCHGCPYQFEHLDIKILNGHEINGVKWTIGNFDIVADVGKRIEFIAETKFYRNASSYKYFFIPIEQLVLYKKGAKSFRCDFYFIISDGYQYYLTEIDRFARYEPIKYNGKKVVPFHRDAFRVLTESELEMFFVERYG